MVSDDFDVANVNQHVMIIRLANLELRKYIHSVVISPTFKNKLYPDKLVLVEVG